VWFRELPDRHALRNRTGIATEGEHPIVDELEHHRGNEDIHHAPNPETMIQGQALSCLKVGNAGGSLPGEARTGGHRHGARKARPNNCVEVIVERLQNRPRYPGNASKAATIAFLN
jgi:hypothetical protein